MRVNADKYDGWRFLYSPRWLGYYAMLVVFAIACVLLSNWQFDRREQARQEIERIETNYEAAPVPLSDIAQPQDSFDDDLLKWKPVEATGHYIGDTVLVRNRPGAGGTGSELAQAFLTDENTVIFINRGWVDVTADNPAGDGTLPEAKNGESTTVIARLRASEPVVPGRTSAGLTVGSLNIDEVAQVAGVADENVYSQAFGMLVSENPAFDHGALPAKPEKDEGFHLSYALQWLVFILIAGVGVGYAARQEFRNFNEGSERVKEMNDKRDKRKQRRGLSDAEEEDAWLDARL